MAEENKSCTLGGTEHCWENQSSVSYNNTDRSTVDVQTQTCRHCPVKRERRTVMRVEYKAIEDSGWQQK